jgi:hypothetical protein
VLIQIEDEHAVLAHTCKPVPGISRHQAGTHPADLATAAVHLELGATGKGHHQLVVVVGVVMGLIVQAQEAGFEHGAI